MCYSVVSICRIVGIEVPITIWILFELRFKPVFIYYAGVSVVGNIKLLL